MIAHVHERGPTKLFGLPIIAAIMALSPQCQWTPNPNQTASPPWKQHYGRMENHQLTPPYNPPPAFLHPTSSFESTSSPHSPPMVHSGPPPMHHPHHHHHHPHAHHHVVGPVHHSYDNHHPAPVPYYVPSMPHYNPYYPTWPPPLAPSHHHPPPPPMEYITELQPNDVLSGRGGATNSYNGNRAFRVLVKQYQQKYLTAKKRDKPAVATEIVAVIRKRNGRFLRRWNEQQTGGTVVWVDIGDDRAREKTCQALREGAPEMRKRFQDGKQPEDQQIHHETQEDEEKDVTVVRKEPCVSPKQNENKRKPEATHDAPIVIRPWMRLLPKQDPVEPMELDQLSPEDRDVYLRDFFPPSDTTAPDGKSEDDSKPQWLLVAAS